MTACSFKADAGASPAARTGRLQLFRLPSYYRISLPQCSRFDAEREHYMRSMVQVFDVFSLREFDSL